MPLAPVLDWPRRKIELYRLGEARVRAFCRRNGLSVPRLTLVEHTWDVNACAYYRPERDGPEYGLPPGINLCLPLCGSPAPEEPGRNWSWPGSVVDREPCGVMMHELGHHADWSCGVHKGAYFSDHCAEVMAKSGEPPLTSYAATNPAEWYAEAFRLFGLNPDLLAELRPRTCSLLADRWRPIENRPWRAVLGRNCPERVVRSLLNKGAR